MNCFPDRTLVLALAEGGARARARDNEASDRIGGRPDDYHQKVDLAFRQIAAEEPERVRIIDASGSPEEVTAPPARRHCGPAAVIAGQDHGRRAVPRRLEVGRHAPCLAARRTARRRQGALRHGRGRRGCWRRPPARRSTRPGSTSPTTIRSAGWSWPAATPISASSSAREQERHRPRAQHQRRPGALACRAVRRHAGLVAVAGGGDRQRRRPRAVRRQRLAEDARGAAGQLPVPARQPCARPLAADDPLALPPARIPAVGR